MEGPDAAAPVQTSAQVRERDKDGRIGYVLKTPITFGTETITELRFREIKARDLRSMPLSTPTIGHALDVAAKLCGQPPAVLDELSVEDFQEVSLLIGIFPG